MSCKECQEAQDRLEVYFYRCRNANIEMSGCKEHIKEIFEVLNNHQSAHPDR